MSSTAAQKAFAHSEAYNINGIHTEIVLHKFANRNLLFITQYEKLNNVFIACNDLSLAGIVKNRALTIKNQFGMTTDEIECCIRYLLINMQLPNFDKDMEVVVCLGLKKFNGKILRQIAGILTRLGQTS